MVQIAFESSMPAFAKGQVRRALEASGYSIVREDFRFGLRQEDADRESTDLVPMAAFWQNPPDQFSSAVALAWVPDQGATQGYLRGIREGLWAPYSVVAGDQGWQLWETLPSGPDRDVPFVLLESSSDYEVLAERMVARTDQLGPAAVASRKRRWRQIALYEASPEPNAFIEWAFKPARMELARVVASLLKAVRGVTPNDSPLEGEYLRWALRMLGVRIAWDKRWLDAGRRGSSEDIFSEALRYPTRIADLTASDRQIAEAVADLVASKLGVVHLGAADGGLLSQVIQGSGLPLTLQQRWKLYPTPPDIAWRVLESLPIEAIPDADRKVWDGTCGSGTFLVAALDRLRALVPYLEGQALRQYLVDSLRGNDLQVAMTDATRIALDSTLGAAAGPEWRLSTGDVLDVAAPSAAPIIIGNPPFKARGRTPDLAIAVAERYLEVLPPGGLFGVVMPRTVLATDAGEHLRSRLLHECELMEVMELPAGAFRRTALESAVITGRRRYAYDDADEAVTWRSLHTNRTTYSVDAVPQRAWTETPRNAFWSPLALRLQTHFETFPRLKDYLPENNRSQGVTPGPKANPDVIAKEPKPGFEPYLKGWEGIEPFAIHWEAEPNWINPDSPLIHRSRPKKLTLFRSPKLLVTRQATWGYTWRVRAAIDDRGLIPSDQFLALAPVASLSLDFLAGMFNSALVNAWFRLVNPSSDLRLEEILELWTPRSLAAASVRDVEVLARQLRQLRSMAAESRQVLGGDRVMQLRHLTLTLDDAVYDALEVPDTLRTQVSSLFLWRGDPRPGFEELVVAPPLSGSDSESHPSQTDTERMAELFATNEERELTAEEDLELETLNSRWWRANLYAVRRRRQEAINSSHRQRHPVNRARIG